MGLIKQEEINSPETGFTDQFLTHAMTPQNVGMLSNPDGSGSPQGTCGDTIEINLRVLDDSITDCVFMTDGCAHTIACGSAITTLAKGRAVAEALKLEPEDVSGILGGLPQDHQHCARLAVTGLRLAIKDYLKNKNSTWKKYYSR